MPAHNEAGGIGPTIDAVRAQLRPGDRLLVVADNCADRTCDVARERGAEVVERAHATDRGKGFALDFGVRHLERSSGTNGSYRPPGVVIIVDADVLPGPGAIDALASQVARTGHPAQAVYLMAAPPEPSLSDQVSRFAFTVRNLVRPVGLARLGGPCPLFGCGMAFPWATIAAAPLATGDLVEDMKLGLDLAAEGHAPRLCESSRFLGGLPADAAAAEQQRLRWDQGHLRSMGTQVPGLIARGLGGLVRGRPALLVLALDAAVPPLTLLVALVGGGFVVAVALAATTAASWGPAVALGAGLVAVKCCVVAAWAKWCRADLPAAALVGVPGYLVRRLPAHRAIFAGRPLDWVRTPRDHETRAAVAPAEVKVGPKRVASSEPPVAAK